MKQDPSQAGFSLVEIALALLVAGLGVMAVFALVPQAMDYSRRSVESSEVAAFANFVFDSLENEAAKTTDTAVDWTTNFADGVNFATNHAFLSKNLRATGPSRNNAEVFYWFPPYYGQGGAGATVTNVNLYVSNYAAAAFTYTLDINLLAGDLKSARLEVWPGDRKSLITAGVNIPDSSVYYRQFVPLQ